MEFKGRREEVRIQQLNSIGFSATSCVGGGWGTGGEGGIRVTATFAKLTCYDQVCEVNSSLIARHLLLFKSLLSEL